MEKKATIISLIALGIIVLTSCCYIVFMGITTKDYNYVQLEVNPRIEFICDKKFNVISAYPLNEDARIVLSDLNLVGLDIEKASEIFLDECSKTGYIDVDGLNNAANITIIDGLTQALDVHVAKSVYKYFRENEVMAIVTETDEDRSMFEEKIKNKVCCSNKLKLLQTMVEKDNSLTISKLNKKHEADLVEMVAEDHSKNPFSPTEEELSKKQQLIETNANTYNTHKKCISKYSKQEFSELFDKFQKTSSKDNLKNFTKEYTNWQKDRIK